MTEKLGFRRSGRKMLKRCTHYGTLVTSHSDDQVITVCSACGASVAMSLYDIYSNKAQAIMRKALRPKVLR